MSVNIWGSKERYEYKQVPTEEKDIDYTPLYNYIDNKKFLSIKDNNVDVKESRIKNLHDPEDDNDAVNKRYVNTRKTKCYVGYLPAEPHENGFDVETYIDFENKHKLFIGSDNRSPNVGWLTRATVESFFILTCPHVIHLWLITLRCCSLRRETSTSDGWIAAPFNMTLTCTGSNDKNTWGNITISREENKKIGLYNHVKVFIDTRNAYKFYKFKFVNSTDGNPIYISKFRCMFTMINKEFPQLFFICCWKC